MEGRVEARDLRDAGDGPTIASISAISPEPDPLDATGEDPLDRARRREDRELQAGGAAVDRQDRGPWQPTDRGRAPRQSKIGARSPSRLLSWICCRVAPAWKNLTLLLASSTTASRRLEGSPFSEALMVDSPPMSCPRGPRR